ncbi:uncharacterized protein ARMOST_17571 [Armillaria ostoyae]|uniref:Uncharacterized protein n=1 Tax=Armillaria ostoyae TaxID=47428 RepID=A0A284RZH3_ARMOS|nr:uncharacterized protein ARMOST_17571 [Armillaria ostoyae]
MIGSLPLDPSPPLPGNRLESFVTLTAIHRPSRPSGFLRNRPGTVEQSSKVVGYGLRLSGSPLQLHELGGAAALTGRGRRSAERQTIRLSLFRVVVSFPLIRGY